MMCSRAHDPVPRWRRIVSRNDHDWDWFPGPDEVLLHFEATHARHVQVENEAGGAARRQGLHEIGAGPECSDAESCGTKQSFQCPADRFLVIHDGDKW